MDLRRLRCFVAVAEELHFNRAAERMHMSQPAMSQNINELEEEIGVPLVERGRPISLTPAGKFFLGEARRMLGRFDVAVKGTRDISKNGGAAVRVGITQRTLVLMLPEIRRVLRERAPDVDLTIEEMTAAQQLTALRGGDIDIALGNALPTEEFTREVLIELPFEVVMEGDHPLADREPLYLRDLADEDFVLFPQEIAPDAYADILSACEAAGFTPKVRRQTYPSQSIAAYVSAGFGIGLMTAIHQARAYRGLLYRKLTGAAPVVRVTMLWRQQDAFEQLLTVVDVSRSVGSRLGQL